jgi:hypothetical protein
MNTPGIIFIHERDKEAAVAKFCFSGRHSNMLFHST